MIAFPDKKYQIIYADPPWSYSNRMYSSNKTDHHRAITRAYDVMSTNDICRLPVRQITHDNCACFMWTTDSHLPDALEVMENWGFKYKTIAFVWNKKELSGKQVCYMGQWTMKGSEICLFGTKGKMTQYLVARNVRQLIEAKRDRTKHSKKPQEVREAIVKMFGSIPKIELFARQKIEGWDCWGNEVNAEVNKCRI